jgi:glycosyltransferase involved in cell wall biosynthesis
MKNNNLLIISNLYPLPWEPNRATFNKQQFELLKDEYNTHIAVPIAWIEYFKNRKKIIEQDGITYFPYFYTPKVGRKYYAKMMEWSFRLFSSSCIKKFGPDKILAAWAFPEGVMGQSIAKKLKIPFYLKVHGSDINSNVDIESRAKQITVAANNSSGVLSVSEALKEKMVNMGVSPEKINVIYNGVHKDKFFPVIDDSPKNSLLYVGNLKEEKGVVELIEGFFHITTKFPDVRLRIAGSGPMENILRDYVNKLKISNKVEFLGSVNHEDIPKLMQQSKFVLLPSYAEGVPNVLLEAMSCGIPVVATNVGGIPEVVIEGLTGCLSNPKSSERFAIALEKALKTNWDKDKIVNHSKHFDWENNKEKLIKMLSDD